MRYQFTWYEANDDCKILRVCYHNAIDAAGAIHKARNQMRVLGYNPFHHRFVFKEVDEQKVVAKKKKPAIMESSKQESFWWVDDKEEF